MLDSLKLTIKQSRAGCGIYEAGDTDKCYTKLFVTDAGRVLPINHRVITEEDLMEAYTWGRLEAVPATADSADEDFEGTYLGPSA